MKDDLVEKIRLQEGADILASKQREPKKKPEKALSREEVKNFKPNPHQFNYSGLHY